MIAQKNGAIKAPHAKINNDYIVSERQAFRKWLLDKSHEFDRLSERLCFISNLIPTLKDKQMKLFAKQMKDVCIEMQLIEREGF